MNIDKFCETVVKEYKKKFPKAWIVAHKRKLLGEVVYISFGVQEKKNLSGGYEENDPAQHKFMIHDVKDGEFSSDKITLDVVVGGSLYIKPAEGSYMAYDKVKIGLRKKTGTPEQIITHLTKYFSKLDKVVKDEKKKGTLAHKI